MLGPRIRRNLHSTHRDLSGVRRDAGRRGQLLATADVAEWQTQLPTTQGLHKLAQFSTAATYAAVGPEAVDLGSQTRRKKVEPKRGLYDRGTGR